MRAIVFRARKLATNDWVFGVPIEIGQKHYLLDLFEEKSPSAKLTSTLSCNTPVCEMLKRTLSLKEIFFVLRRKVTTNSTLSNFGVGCSMLQ